MVKVGAGESLPSVEVTSTAGLKDLGGSGSVAVTTVGGWTGTPWVTLGVEVVVVVAAVPGDGWERLVTPDLNLHGPS